MYKIAICDDEPREIEYISNIISNWNAAEIRAFESAEAFLFEYADNKDWDILLLDIEMKRVNGVELAKRVRRENEGVQIIFVTGYPDFIAEGYDVAAVNYLMKPVSAERLKAALDRAARNLAKPERYIVLNAKGESVRLRADDICFVEAFAHSVTFRALAETFDARMSISEAETLLGKGFIRCHRSYIVGVNHITSMTKTELRLTTGARVPISRAAFGAVNKAFIDHNMGVKP